MTIDGKLKFGHITINDKNTRTSRLYAQSGTRDVSFGVVEVTAITSDKKSLKWTLFTNLELKTPEDALKIVNYYRLRWQVENYFKILKDGCCHVEHACLRSFERLEKYTMCFSIIAWRLFWMKFIYHTDPHLPAKTILTDLEIEVLRVRHPDTVHKDKLKVGQALKLVAMFGGYNNRKGDGPPGNITLWRGFLIVRDRAEYHEELLNSGELRESYRQSLSNKSSK